jgi:hypothetical protein
MTTNKTPKSKPRCRTRFDDALIRELAQAHPSEGCRELAARYKEATGVKVSDATIRGRLKALGLPTARSLPGGPSRAKGRLDLAFLELGGANGHASELDAATATLPIASAKAEVDAMRAIVEALEGLDPATRRRVIYWAGWRYCDNSPGGQR